MVFFSVRLLLVTANVVPISQILVTLMMEALRFSVRQVLTRSTRRNIPVGGILHSHRRENLKYYMMLPVPYIPMICISVKRMVAFVVESKRKNIQGSHLS
jgi:hypothetical protein